MCYFIICSTYASGFNDFYLLFFFSKCYPPKWSMPLFYLNTFLVSETLSTSLRLFRFFISFISLENSPSIWMCYGKLRTDWEKECNRNNIQPNETLNRIDENRVHRLQSIVLSVRVCKKKRGFHPTPFELKSKLHAIFAI